MERNCLRAMYPVLGISRNPINCMEESASWKANSFSVSQGNHDIGTEFGISLLFFTGRCQWSLFWARWIQSISSYPISITPILTLFSHLRLALSTGLFCSVFPISALQAFFSLFFRPSYSTWFGQPDHIWWGIQIGQPDHIWWAIRIMKLVTLQFPSSSYRVLPLRFKYFLQRPFLEHSQFVFFL